MPRGVYDRSKVKKTAEKAPKAAKAAKVAKLANGLKLDGKPGKSILSDVMKVAKSEIASNEYAGSALSRSEQRADTSSALFELERSSNTLLAIYDRVGKGNQDVELVKSITGLLGKVVKKCDAILFPEEKKEPVDTHALDEVAQSAQEVEEKEEVVAATAVTTPVAQPAPTFAPAPQAAPVPFNPPTVQS